MSRKHYREVAEIIKAERNVGHDDGLSVETITGIDLATRNIASRIATMFKIDNSRFDREKFLDACGIE